MLGECNEALTHPFCFVCLLMRPAVEGLKGGMSSSTSTTSVTRSLSRVEVLSKVYVLKQVVAAVLGLLWGIVGLEGVNGFIIFFPVRTLPPSPLSWNSIDMGTYKVLSGVAFAYVTKGTNGDGGWGMGDE